VEVPTSIDVCCLDEALASAARRFAEYPAIITPQRSWTFSEVETLSRRLATRLRSRGIGHGDRVALLSLNSAGFAIAYCGIVRSGAAVLPLNFLYHEKEIAWMLKDAEASGMIFSPELRQKAFTAAQSTGMKLLLELPSIPDQNTDWIQTPAEHLERSRAAACDADDIAAILYTSGTTGRPKGAMLTHCNLVSNAWSVSRALRLQPGADRILLVLPMFHAFAATAGMLHSLLHGIAFIPLPRFDPVEVAESVADHDATVFMGVPAMFAALLRLPDRFTETLSQLKFCISGGAPLPVETLEQFEKRFGVLIYEGDGPTECSPVTCVNPIGGLRKIGSVGRPVELVEMAIMDDSGRRLPPGEIGEICIRGPNVMKGYWKRPEETRAVFFGEWFRTGDIGRQDEDGYFYILDRRKDMLIVNGMNVYPRMIEEVLHRHPDVAEAAVVGMKHALHGEIPVAWIVPAAGRQPDVRSLRRYCAEHLGRHEIPRRFEFTDCLPRTSTGKVDKRILRDRLQSAC